mmetsp:Transcript_2436/g.5590  ORF Transcript_2436/g.5590 Transcript_2436/m.5590 type:complete len:247 (+) Transcript_2436:406-1146(+)
MPLPSTKPSPTVIMWPEPTPEPMPTIMPVPSPEPANIPVPMPSPEPTVTPCPLITPEPTVTPSPLPIPLATCTPAPTTSPFWKSAPAPCAATSPLFIICSVPAKFLMWWNVAPSVTGGGDESSVVAITNPGSWRGWAPPSSAGASSAGAAPSSAGASSAAAGGSSSCSLLRSADLITLLPRMRVCASATRWGSARLVHWASTADTWELAGPDTTRTSAVSAIATAAAPITVTNLRSEGWRLGATAP